MPQFRVGNEVAMTVEHNGKLVKGEFFVAERQYVEHRNKYEYRLEVYKDSGTLYEKGKWFKEGDLEFA